MPSMEIINVWDYIFSLSLLHTLSLPLSFSRSLLFFPSICVYIFLFLIFAFLPFSCRYVNSLNRKGLSYSLRLNHLSDLSDDEMKSMRGYRHTKDAPRGEVYIGRTPPSDLPTYMNWRLRGMRVYMYVCIRKSLPLEN